MKKIVKISCGIIMSMFLVSNAVAIEGGNPKKGKHYYKKECKACHASNGTAESMSPMSKTKSQWDRFFSRDKHKKLPEVFENISEKKLIDINQFLNDFASDSEQPQSCG